MTLRLLALGALALGLPLAAANAAPLTLTPVGIELKAGERATVMRLHSDADQPVSVQARAFSWTQRDGADVLEPTRDLIISPPLATVPAHADQVFRIVRPGVDGPSGEAAYRILVDELPPPVTAGPGTNVTLLTRQSVPVFVEASPAAGKPALSVRLEGGGPERRLVLSNTGDRRIRLADVALGDGEGRTVERDGGLYGYVLSGAVVTRPLRTTGTPTVLSAASDLGPITAPIVGSPAH